MTYLLWALGFAALCAAALAYAYLPTRKKIQIAFDRRWHREARLMSFSREAELRAAANPLVARLHNRSACDVIWYEEDAAPPESLAAGLPYGALVHVHARHIPLFMDSVLPKLRNPIVLQSGFGTLTTRYPGFERIVESPMILQWFLEHFELDREHLGRVTPLPIGMDFHKLLPDWPGVRAYDQGYPSSAENQQLTLEAIRETIPPIGERPLIAYANFHLTMDVFLKGREARKRRPARLEALDQLKGKAHVRFESRQRARNGVWARHREFAFEVSPRGNGIDCHRTWEALVLKTIPIVKTSRFDPAYDGLPVAIVEDWDEVTPARMMAWREKFQDQIDGPLPAKLYSQYWIEAMRAYGRNRG